MIVRVALVALALATVAGLGLALADHSESGGAGEPAGANVEVPRVCWFSDYDKDPPGLSNRCRFDDQPGEWMIEVRDQWKPARGRRLPTANLCHYIAGAECPKR